MANDTIKTWMPDEIAIAFGPVIIDSGFAEDEFIRLEQDSDDTEDVVGVDGEVTVSRTNDRRATLTIILMHTSKGNDGLTTLSGLTRTAPGMAGAIQPMLIKDLNGRAIYTAQNSWIAAAPPVSYARKATSREWKIRIANLVRVDGGS
jgi:hypothetical protein